MSKKKTPPNHQGSRKILDDSLTVQNILEFADCLLDDWRPYILNELTILLAVKKVARQRGLNLKEQIHIWRPFEVSCVNKNLN